MSRGSTIANISTTEVCERDKSSIPLSDRDVWLLWETKVDLKLSIVHHQVKRIIFGFLSVLDVLEIDETDSEATRFPSNFIFNNSNAIDWSVFLKATLQILRTRAHFGTKKMKISICQTKSTTKLMRCTAVTQFFFSLLLSVKKNVSTRIIVNFFP